MMGSFSELIVLFKPKGCSLNSRIDYVMTDSDIGG